MRQKKGQFFLITAVVIVVVIVSIVTISNYTQKRDNIKLYDLGKELGIESQHVLDYGTYSELNESEMKELMETFIQNYVNYIGEDKNIYFIYGNSLRINVIGYQDIVEEKVEICFDVSKYGGGVSKGTVTEGECIPYITIGEAQEFSKASGEIDEIVAIIGDTNYKFNLKQGENFYFIIWQEIAGEKYVVTSEEE